MFNNRHFIFFLTHITICYWFHFNLSLNGGCFWLSGVNRGAQRVLWCTTIPQIIWYRKSSFVSFCKPFFVLLRLYWSWVFRYLYILRFDELLSSASVLNAAFMKRMPWPYWFNIVSVVSDFTELVKLLRKIDLKSSGERILHIQSLTGCKLDCLIISNIVFQLKLSIYYRFKQKCYFSL